MKSGNGTILASLCLMVAATAACAADSAALPAAPAATAPAAGSPTLEEVMKDPNRKVGFIRKTLKLDDGTERIYQVWVPLDYAAGKKWPVILFLHGKGESGTDGEKVLIQGLPKEIKKRDGKFEFIVVIPQSASGAAMTVPSKDAPKTAEKGPASPAAPPRPRGGWVGADEEFAIKALQATQREYTTDPDRVYLTGLSMGGFGTWSFAWKYPNAYAAIVPICGGGDPSKAATFAHIPTWVWHGDADKTVPPDLSRKMVEALKAAGAKEVKYSELPGVGHNSWDQAYASDELWTWLLAHRRADK
ncbi:MAG: prolyl oligopeptidase family serine peptidase [Planctomycetota bacterium]|nr:prolyl oligopeptidase family serine peptidase [Planctomycetota bacterium]